VSEPAIDILLVCTANVCRSPMAEALLRERLRARHVGGDVRVTSAGLLGAGLLPSEAAVTVLAERGLDLSEHRSRLLEASLLDVDLVVGMERRHVREMVVLRPDVWPRAFTLKELVRRGEAAGPRAANEALAAWLARVDAGRTRADAIGSSRDDDVADPIGRPIADFERTVAELDDLLARVVALLWP
jgi:protein-tyrosine phosphatase